MLTNIADISSYNVVYKTVNPVLADTTFTNFTQIEALGFTLYTIGAILLIITSVILLLAMVGAIVITIKQ